MKQLLEGVQTLVQRNNAWSVHALRGRLHHLVTAPFAPAADGDDDEMVGAV